ncbi:MAG: FMN-binding protein, partial [Clostridia bacterium]|nr:FMN-binding protein [Clostridia bacterium]
GKVPPVEGVDVASGATVSSNAIINAVNEAAANNTVEAPAEEEAIAEPIEGITVEASGLTGKFPVTVSFNDDGSVKAVTVGESDSANDVSFLAIANTEAFLSQFIGKVPPVEGVDVASGATVSSNAIINAVNEAYASVQ